VGILLFLYPNRYDWSDLGRERFGHLQSVVTDRKGVNNQTCRALQYSRIILFFLLKSFNSFEKCDVIYEKGPYCGTYIIGPDQTTRMMRGV